jgi:transcriptional regulator with XRE-family HTH domain
MMWSGTMTADGPMTFAAKLRELVETRGMSLRGLAREAHLDSGYLTKIANGQRRPSEDMAQKLDKALGANGELLVLAPLPKPRRPTLLGSAVVPVGTMDQGPTPGEGDDDVKRRAAMQLIAALSAGAAAPPGTVETVLSGIENALGNPLDVSEWQRAAFDYDHQIHISPAGALVKDLAADIIAIGELLKNDISESQQRELLRVCAALSGLLGVDLGDAGDRRGARIAWATAIRAADASADTAMRVWTRGRAAQDAFMAERSPHVITALVEEAQHIAGDSPSGLACDGLARAYSARAYLAVQRGEHSAEISRAMGELNRTQEKAGNVDIAQSIFGYRETQMLWSQAYVYVLTNDKRAESILNEARSLYPDNALAARANLALMESIRLVKSGEVTTGLQQAVDTLQSQTRSNGGGRILSGSLLESLPGKARMLPEARELRALVATTQ